MAPSFLFLHFTVQYGTASALFYGEKNVSLSDNTAEMLIARQKRKENIAEYILYIWQLEDLLRALQFSPEAIYSQLVAAQEIDDGQKQDIFFWYIDMANLIKSEGKDAHGHIDHTLQLIGDLNELHQSLLKLPSGEEYRKIFAPLAEELPALKERLGKPDMSDIEVAMRSLYSVILYRLKGDESRAEYVNDVLALVSPVVAKLSEIFHAIESGKFNLYEESK